MRKATIFILLILLIALDLGMKEWAINLVYPISVFRNFFGVDCSLVYATNTGMAWSLLSDYPHLLLWVRIALIGLLSYYLYSKIETPKVWPLILILAGALGNVFDVLYRGHVVDMFFFVLWGYEYPVFNVADSLICIGLVWFLCLKD